MSTSVWLVRNQNLMEMWWLFTSLMATPTRIFMRSWASPVGWFFTFVVPVLIVVNVPAHSMVKGLDRGFAGMMLLVAVVLLFLSRQFFRFALRTYRRREQLEPAVESQVLTWERPRTPTRRVSEGIRRHSLTRRVGIADASGWCPQEVSECIQRETPGVNNVVFWIHPGWLPEGIRRHDHLADKSLATVGQRVTKESTEKRRESSVHGPGVAFPSHG